MLAQLSKVYEQDKKFRFFAKTTETAKGYIYEQKREAVKARARLLKRLKRDGFKVYG